MKKIATLYLILFCSFFIAHAQLNKLCPISSTVYDKKKIQDVNLLLTTKDFVSVMNPKKATKAKTETKKEAPKAKAVTKAKKK